MENIHLHVALALAGSMILVVKALRRTKEFIEKQSVDKRSNKGLASTLCVAVVGFQLEQRTTSLANSICQPLSLASLLPEFPSFSGPAHLCKPWLSLSRAKMQLDHPKFG